ncbi:MAG: hypothetical protein ICV55_04225 [Coleofasciculus sp. C3-bin4]|nr:hypothetical protein [Coleofasciculus sp. C3-bin4]
MLLLSLSLIDFSVRSPFTSPRRFVFAVDRDKIEISSQDNYKFLAIA